MSNCKCGKEITPSAWKCTCGKFVGFCSACREYANVEFVKNHWLARDDYRCCNCGTGLVQCCHRSTADCQGWVAASPSGGFASNCVPCSHDPVVVERDQVREKRMNEAAQRAGEKAGQDFVNNLFGKK